MKEDEAKNAHNAEADDKRLPEAVREGQFFVMVVAHENLLREHFYRT